MFKEILKQHWGYDSFRGVQEEIITSICEGRDTLGLMPTGGGKSVTFQVPALCMEGLCLVVTPLIALMKDQVQNLRARGIKALAIYSGMSREEILTTLDNCIFGNYKFLYISPERLGTELFRMKVQKIKVSMITVDESHCISQWGYDFRPAYLKIAEIRELLPGVPVLALTATATPEVVKDIQQQLHFKQENVFSMSFERKNLAYVVRTAEDKLQELLHILKSTSGSAIVYVRNRRRTKEICELLRKSGITAEFYHAGLDHAVRDARQQQWKNEESRVMVATNAFGMGIDKPNVRLVLHADLPDSIEAYFQEAGRAGRDGQKAYAVLLYNRHDRTMLHKRVPDTFPTKDYIRKVYEDLQFYYQMAMGDGMGCIKAFNLEDFCSKFKHFPVQADSALRLLTQAGYIEYTDEQNSASRLMFTLGREELYRLHEMDSDTDRLIHVVLRSYTGLFSEYAYISEELLALRLNMSRQDVYQRLVHLSRLHIVSYIPGKKTPYIIYTRERMETGDLHFSKQIYEVRREHMEKQIEAMLHYAEDESSCRSRMLLRYFGEDNPHNCGHCDTCLRDRELLGKPAAEVPAAACEQITALLRQGPLTVHQLWEKTGMEKDVLAQAVRQLTDQGIINGQKQLLSIE